MLVLVLVHDCIALSLMKMVRIVWGGGGGGGGGGGRVGGSPYVQKIECCREKRK